MTFKRPSIINVNPESTQNLGDDNDLSTIQARLKYDPSTTQVAQLIKLMDVDYMSLKDIMALFKLNSVKRFRENYLNPSIEDGAIERLFPEHPKHPKQKYRLTEVAKEWKSHTENNLKLKNHL